MNHLKALVIKFLASLLVLYLILGVFYELTFGQVFFITAVLGIVAYIIGDLFILRRTNNIIATVADFGLALLIIHWLAKGFTPFQYTFAASLIAALAVAIFEEFFHRYLANQTFSDRQEQLYNRSPQYQIETSEELTEPVNKWPDPDKKKD